MSSDKLRLYKFCAFTIGFSSVVLAGAIGYVTGHEDGRKFSQYPPLRSVQ